MRPNKSLGRICGIKVEEAFVGINISCEIP